MGVPVTRVLAVHRYYWPDTPPYASLLRRIVASWAATVDVDVLTAQPSYKSESEPRQPRREVMDGAVVRRLRLRSEVGRPVRRIVNSLRMGWSIFWRSASGRYDTVMVSTMPPVVPGVAASLGCRISGARLFYHCMDLHPEVGRISGEFSHPLVYRVLLRLDSATCRQADTVIVLSKDMADAVRARPGCANARIEVVNNFALPSGSEFVEPPLPGTECVRLLFAGNVGRFQGLETVIEAMHRRAARGRNDVEFVVLGTGAALPDLQARAMEGPARGQVRFVPHQPVEVAKAAMRQSDIGLVALIPGIHRYVFPSKTMTYLEQGLPLLVVVEQSSALAETVATEGIGWSVAPGQPEALEAVLDRLAENRDTLKHVSARAESFADREFSADWILRRWEVLLHDEGIEHVTA